MEEKETKKKTSTKSTNKTASKTTTKAKTGASASKAKAKSASKASSTVKGKAQGSKQGQAKKSTVKTASKKAGNSKTTKKQIEKTNLKVEKPELNSEKVHVKDTSSSHDEREISLEKTIIFDGLQSKNINDVVNKLEEDKVVLEDKVIQRSKVRKVMIFVLVLGMICVVLATAKYVIDYTQTKATIDSDVYSKASKKYDSEDDIEESEHSDLIKDIEYENIETITLSDFEKKALNKEDMVVLVASTTCYNCITFEPVVDEVFGERDQKIYRINISSMSKEDVTKFRTYYAFKATPTIFAIQNGVVIADVRGAMNKENLEKWLDENL